MRDLLHASIFDAVNGINSGHEPCRVRLPAPAGATEETVALGAAHEILANLYPSRRGAFDAELTQNISCISRSSGLLSRPSGTLSSIPNGGEGCGEEALLPSIPAVRSFDGGFMGRAGVRGQSLSEHHQTTAPSSTRAPGLLYGRTVAQAMLAWRARDFSSATVPYIVRTNAGQWQRTPPQFRPPELPNWTLVTPFCLTNLAPFRQPGPPALDSERYAQDVNQVKELGALHSRTRTPEQTEIARFWADFSYTVTPVGHWNQIAQDISRRNKFTLAQNARIFALLNLAMADAAIVAWEAKYTHNLWRPVTAIRQADRDGNPATTADPDWQPLLTTPPFPEYVSGHSIFSATAAEVIAAVLGTDEVTFTATSDTLAGITRTYHSLRVTAEEIGMSRIYGGIHFLSGDLDGLAAGRVVGSYVAENYLLPVKKSQLALGAADRARDGKEAR